MLHGICFECDKRTLDIHWHHVVPESRGGKRVVPLCEICHGLVHMMDLRSSELTRVGMQRARERGVIFGRPRVCSVEEVKRMRGLGWTQKRIADELGVAETTVWAVCQKLKNEF